MSLNLIIALVLVFAMVLLLVNGFSHIDSSEAQKALRTRLAAVRKQSFEGRSGDSLIREKYLRELSPLERRLEELPGMVRVTRLLEQTGRNEPGYRFLARALLLAFFFSLPSLLIFGFAIGLLVFVAVPPLPLLRVLAQRRERIKKFEEQLPDALDLMSRALRAGMPLMDSFRFVAEEMPAPISDEFRTTWSHLNYGISPKASFEDLTQRIPCTSLSAMTTAVLIQRETGGNLAEILDKISAVLRGRFRFQRKLKTLTAEGRMSAWILILLPFVLSGVIALTSPSYLPMLLNDPLGGRLVLASLVSIGIGALWIRSIIRVPV
ncbi:tight adherence protein B [Solimonas aquatica]|uniref:Tight adherence protein B n=1 Tax=Solimonas aquatica TaxID=489703 RepID=A0A1H9HY91_9GAMM|nr:type II secretion system F family protein [Solimonas aquatica]SEQ67175.1 tight adherence protein B [Solimonas aquatica]